MIPAELADIRIRYVEPGDSSIYIAQEKDTGLKKFMGGASPRTEESLRLSLLGYKPSFSFMAIARAATNQYLGRCGYLDTDEPLEKELYILLGYESQKKGYGAIVVPFLVSLAKSQGYRSVAYVDPENTGSLKLLAKLKWINIGKVEKDNYQLGHLKYVPPREST